MFSKHPEHALTDLSIDLHDEQDWKLGSLRILDFPLDITSLAVEPVVIGLLAVGMYLLTFLALHMEHPTGTSSGAIYIFGGPGVQSKLTLPRSAGIRFVHFSASTCNIVCLGAWHILVINILELIFSSSDDNNDLHVWDLLNFGRPKLVASAHFDPTKYDSQALAQLLIIHIDPLCLVQ